MIDAHTCKCGKTFLTIDEWLDHVYDDFLYCQPVIVYKELGDSDWYCPVLGRPNWV